MRKLRIFMISCTLLSSIILLDFNVNAGECTPGDVLKFLDKGLSKDEINTICKETLFEKDPMCCCEMTRLLPFITPRPGADPTIDYNVEYRHGETRYKWMKATKCTASTRAESRDYHGTNAKCSNASNCGK